MYRLALTSCKVPRATLHPPLGAQRRTGVLDWPWPRRLVSWSEVSWERPRRPSVVIFRKKTYLFMVLSAKLVCMHRVLESEMV